MQHIYLSPHFDDAVYSCGGLIHAQTRAGDRVRVLTVFAGEPMSGQLSQLAGRLHRNWRQGADAALERAREDAEALRVLGATGESWAFQDAIYRQSAAGAFLYPTFEALFLTRNGGDQALAAAIKKQLLQLAATQSCTTLFYAPLGIGRHVDHVLVYEAGRALQAAGYSVRFYEDLPYVANSATLLGGALLADRTVWWQHHSRRVDLRQKVQAMACYPSQSHHRLVHQVADYARQVGGSAGPAERVWEGIPRRQVSARDWAAFLSCPRCRGAFLPVDAAWTCKRCGHTYPYRHGILDLRDVAGHSAGAFHWSRQPRRGARAPVANAAQLLGRLLRLPRRPPIGGRGSAALAIGGQSTTALLALASVSGQVVGLHGSMQALRRSRRLLHEHGVGDSCLLVASAPGALPCPDHAFGDIVVDRGAVSGAAGPAFRQEVFRVLQPGGTFLYYSAHPFRALAQTGLTAGLKIVPRRWRPRVERNLRNLGVLP